MSVMTMLQAAQGGKLFSHVAESLDLDEAETRKAMGLLCPAIAGRLKDAAAADDDLLQSLLDLIEDGAGALPLEETDAVTGEEAVSDGNAILEDIYGSRNDALVALRAAATDVPERELAKLAPISATVVVAALAQSNAPMGLTGVQPVGDQGILGTIIGGVLNGVVQGVVRELKSSKGWRSATGYTKSRAKRKTSSASRKKTTKSRTTRSSSSKRRTTSASIEDIFRDILGNIGK